MLTKGQAFVLAIETAEAAIDKRIHELERFDELSNDDELELEGLEELKERLWHV